MGPLIRSGLGTWPAMTLPMPNMQSAVELATTADLFSLSLGDIVSKRNLYDLVQFSKVAASDYWSGADGTIGNTPQQGINWIGLPPVCQGVIIKTRAGAYEHDGWLDESRTKYRYSFKARSGVISLEEKANAVLVEQPQYLYPVLLFTEHKNAWRFEGTFTVSEIESQFVILRRGLPAGGSSLQLEGVLFSEGSRKYVTHLRVERSKEAVDVLKSMSSWDCEICKENFEQKYGIPYIEAHHKQLISAHSAEHSVSLSDFALLCPNCHRAVHVYMRQDELDYEAIKTLLKGLV